MFFSRTEVKRGKVETLRGTDYYWKVAAATLEKTLGVTLFVGVSAPEEPQSKFVHPALTLDDAEAIGYSLLYAVKLQRDKEANE